MINLIFNYEINKYIHVSYKPQKRGKLKCYVWT